MFPRAKRLSRAAFGQASVRAKRLSGEHFSLSFPATSQGYAVVVSKTVAKSSVARHKLKRQIFEAMKALPLPPSLIIYAKKGSPTLSFTGISRELRAILAQVR